MKLVQQFKIPRLVRTKPTNAGKHQHNNKLKIKSRDIRQYTKKTALLNTHTAETETETESKLQTPGHDKTPLTPLISKAQQSLVSLTQDHETNRTHT